MRYQKCPTTNSNLPMFKTSIFQFYNSKFTVSISKLLFSKVQMFHISHYQNLQVFKLLTCWGPFPTPTHGHDTLSRFTFFDLCYTPLTFYILGGVDSFRTCTVSPICHMFFCFYLFRTCTFYIMWLSVLIAPARGPYVCKQ